MNHKTKRNLYFLVLILVIIITTSAITYAYFKIKLNGIESSSTINVGGSVLELNYIGTKNIIADNIYPGWKDTKLFNVEVNNTTGKTVKYDINIEVIDSNFYTTASSDKGYLQYVLKKCTSASTDTCTEELVGASIIDVQTGTKKVTTIETTEESSITYYSLEVIFPETGEVQSQRGTDGGLFYFSGYVTIYSNTNTKPSFAEDSWETIASNVRAGNTKGYIVGEEKEVIIDGESYTVRLANNSHYDCIDDDGNQLASETACGFVVEFVDIVGEAYMDTTEIALLGSEPSGGSGNAGGWPATQARTYVNSTFYNKLPSNMQSIIIDTTVVSGHGCDDRTNHVSTDKLYLLSPREVWNYNGYDTAYSSTRQLDYYANLGVTTTDNYSAAIKEYNGSAAKWSLRNASDGYCVFFSGVGINGNFSYSGSNGVSPAFRIK